MTRESRDAMFMALRRLGTWRSFFAARHIGPTTAADPEARAFIDFYEKWLLLRVEVSTVSYFLIEKGIVTREEFHEQMAIQADGLSATLSRAFPGITATDDGLDLGDMKTFMAEVNVRRT